MGKGSTRRDAAVDEATQRANWERTFGRRVSPKNAEVIDDTPLCEHGLPTDIGCYDCGLKKWESWL